MPQLTRPIRIGIDLGGTKTEGTALTPDGTDIGSVRMPTPGTSYSDVIENIALVIDTLCHTHDIDRSQATVGIGIPGAICPHTQKVKNANLTLLIGHKFDDDMSARLNMPVRIANDANCFAVSEATDGAARGAHVTFGVILGTGCGGGIAIDGEVLTGGNAIAGEWGHNPLPWPHDNERPGPLCYCGKTGCLETWISGPGFERDHDERTGARHNAVEIITQMRQGDIHADMSFKLYCDRLARGLASVINILDPDCIVLGGGLSNIDELYTEIPNRLPSYVFSEAFDTKIRKNLHGDASGVRGAAWLWPVSST